MLSGLRKPKTFSCFLLYLYLACSQYALADEKEVKLSTLEWPPYIGESLQSKGYVHEIVKRAFEKAGYNVKITFYPWARALHTASSGESDGLFPEYYDESRLTDFVFSDPFPGGPVGFYKRRGDNIKFTVDPRIDPEKALQGLKAYSFGVVRGYINTKAFDEADYLLKDPIVDDDLNLKKLFSKRIDLIFIDKYVASYLITEKYPWMTDSLEFMEPELEIKKLYVAFSKKSPNYLRQKQDFNKGLKLMNESGEIADLMLHFGF